MGKVNNALRMLAILRSRKKVSRNELAEELEVSAREITRYKEALEYAGVNIINTLGRYGGYELKGNDYLLSLDLSKAEIKSLKAIEETLKYQGSHLFYDMRNINDKIIASRKTIDESYLSTQIAKGISIKVSYEEERNKWLTINDAIINNRKISISYINAIGEKSERIVDPYELFTYYGANFFIGFCNFRNEFRQFKLVRIKEIKLLKENFNRRNFYIDDYIKVGIGLIGENTIDIILKIDYPYAQGFQEFRWLSNEKINDYKNEGYIIYKGSCKGIIEVTNWILGMGSNCTVISPNELVEKVKNEIRKILDRY